MDRYDGDQRKEASRLLKNLYERPADFHHHIQLATGALALSIAYGVPVDSSKNPYFHAAEETTESLQAALVPGAFPVEFFPIRELSLLPRPFRHDTKPDPWIVRYFPSWFPGGGSRSYGERVYKCSMDSITLPMQYATERLKVRVVCVCENNI